MRFLIITPSYNQVDHLRRCVKSVADQVGSQSEQRTVCHAGGTEAESQGSEVNGQRLEGGDNLNPKTRHLKHRLEEPITVRHHVQDGGSTDGTREFLAEHLAHSSKLTANGYTFSNESEKDEGMYDAINKGIEKAFGGSRPRALGIGETNNNSPITNNGNDSVVAWLNCDEQYLPHTLEKVAAFFVSNPTVDLLFGGMLVVDEAGELLSCRKAMPMRKHFLEASYLYNYSCAMFFRESLWRRLGGFDTSFKNTGDEELVRRAMGAEVFGSVGEGESGRVGVRSGVLGEYLSTFCYGTENLSSDPSAVEEHERLKGRMAKPLRLAFNVARLAEKFVRRGHVQRGVVEYEIYAGSSGSRERFRAENPSCNWPGEAKPYLMKHRLEGGNVE